MLRCYRGSTIPRSLFTANYALVLKYWNIPFAAKLLHLLSFTRVSGWTLNGIWSFLTPCYQQVASRSGGLKIARLYKRHVSGRVTLLPGTELWLVSFNKPQQKEKAFSRNIHGARMFPQCFPKREALFPISGFVSKMQFVLRLHENPSMRAVAKILRPLI